MVGRLKSSVVQSKRKTAGMADSGGGMILRLALIRKVYS